MMDRTTASRFTMIGRKLLPTLLAGPLVAGCILQPVTLNPSEVQSAALMPPTAATRLLSRYFGPGKKEDLAESVTLVFYNMSYNDLGLQVGAGPGGACLHGINEESARRIYVA